MIRDETETIKDITQNLAGIRQDSVELCMSTKQMDKKEIERFVCLAYESAGLQPPTMIEWASSPFEGLVASMKVQDYICGHVKDLDAMSHVLSHCGWCWVFQKTVILTEKPASINLDMWSPETKPGQFNS